VPKTQTRELSLRGPHTELLFSISALSRPAIGAPPGGGHNKRLQADEGATAESEVRANASFRPSRFTGR